VIPRSAVERKAAVPSRTLRWALDRGIGDRERTARRPLVGSARQAEEGVLDQV
jgi:hypothetical protein